MFKRMALLLTLTGTIFAAQVANAASDDGTITVGSACMNSTEFLGYTGGVGAYSPTGLTGGKTVGALMALAVPCMGGTFSGHLAVTGFSSDPGQSWLTSVACNGTTKTGATATYVYTSASGTATWNWSATTWGFGAHIGSQLGCTIVHS